MDRKIGLNHVSRLGVALDSATTDRGGPAKGFPEPLGPPPLGLCNLGSANTQGVALGWYRAAPLGRSRGAKLRSPSQCRKTFAGMLRTRDLVFEF